MNRTIYIADDGEDDRFLLERAFKQAGVLNPRLFFDHGEKLTTQLKSLKEGADDLPRLIILDIKMPLMDGLETLRWIKNEPRFKNIPVLMMTASNSDRDSQSAKESGADSYLVKPSAFEYLCQMVDCINVHWIVES